MENIPVTFKASSISLDADMVVVGMLMSEFFGLMGHGCINKGSLEHVDCSYVKR